MELIGAEATGGSNQSSDDIGTPLSIREGGLRGLLLGEQPGRHSLTGENKKTQREPLLTGH